MHSIFGLQGLYKAAAASKHCNRSSAKSRYIKLVNLESVLELMKDLSNVSPLDPRVRKVAKNNTRGPSQVFENQIIYLCSTMTREQLNRIACHSEIVKN